ncbi:RDD family protein [Novosphingobium beihaiensis]|uniref:RDD family protein n=1 Tax=Novosphingobium beihaiensis TaxID=2930389 RepID=A0ABT0BRX6_9SPHN|nr:RDD family protein [Novosphingobium beihaiensis]MCJ2187820.1 RDD family protein [Novosphingobium beihaiensis]
MQPYGGFWWRVLAYLIDFVILYIASTVLMMILGMGAMFSSLAGEQAQMAAAMSMGLVMMAISLIGNWLYFALMESSSLQATVGKLAVGLVVTDQNGKRLSFARATGRYFAKILSGLILFIGYIMVAFTERKQGLHDLIAGTLVWKTRDPRSVVQHEDVFA